MTRQIDKNLSNKTRIYLKKGHHAATDTSRVPSNVLLQEPDLSPEPSRIQAPPRRPPQPRPRPLQQRPENRRLQAGKSTNSSRSGAQLSFETQQSDCRSDLGGRVTNSRGGRRVSRKLQEEDAACGGIFGFGLRGRFTLV